MATPSTLEFVPTQGELSVVAAILEYARSHYNRDSSNLYGASQIDSDNVAQVLQTSGLSYEDLADIWSLADEDGDGILSEKELAIAVRLIGWAQSGQRVNRSFINYANGPMPNLKDVWENKWDAVPEPVQFPPVNLLDKIEFNRTFREAGPANGLLSGDKVRDIYLKTNLSFSDLDLIWNLIDVEQRGSLNNVEFSVGMYLIQALKTCQLTTLPASIPSHIYDQLSIKSHSPFATHRSPSKSAPLPWKSPSLPVKTPVFPPPQMNSERWDVSVIEQAEARGYFDSLDVDQKGLIDGDDSARFMLKCFQLSPNDIAEIWDLVDLRRDNQLNKDQLAVAVHLIHRKLEGDPLPSLELPASLIPPSMRSRPQPQNHVRRASAPVPPKKPPPPIPSVTRKPSSSMSSTSPILKRATSFSPASPTLRPPKAYKPESRDRFSIAAIPETSFPISRTPNTLSIPLPPLAPKPPQTSNAFAHTRISRTPIPEEDDSKTLPPLPPISPRAEPPPVAPADSFDKEIISELKAEKKQLRGQIEELMVQLKGQNYYRDQNDILKEDNSRLKKRLQEMEQAITQVIEANEGADRTDELAQEVTRLSQLLVNHEHTEAELRETLDSVAELSQENKLITQKYEDLKVEKGSLERELADAGNKMEDLESEKNSIATRLAEMEKLLVDPQGKGSSKRELQMLLKDVTKENEALKSREREMQQQMSTMLLTNQNHFQLDDLKRENSRLKLQVEELEGLVQGMQASSSDNVLKRRINELEREKEVLHTQVTEMTGRVAAIEELGQRKIETLQRRISELEAVNNILRHQQAVAEHHDVNAPPPAYEEVSAGR